MGPNDVTVESREFDNSESGPDVSVNSCPVRTWKLSSKFDNFNMAKCACDASGEKWKLIAWIWFQLFWHGSCKNFISIIKVKVHYFIHAVYNNIFFIFAFNCCWKWMLNKYEIIPWWLVTSNFIYLRTNVIVR